MQSVAVHWVSRPWGFPGSIGQVHPLPTFCLGHPVGAIKQPEMAATCAGLGVSQVKPSLDSIWLLLGLTEANCCLFDRI